MTSDAFEKWWLIFHIKRIQRYISFHNHSNAAWSTFVTHLCKNISLSAPHPSCLIGVCPTLLSTHRYQYYSVEHSIFSRYKERKLLRCVISLAGELRYWDAPVGGALTVLYSNRRSAEWTDFLLKVRQLSDVHSFILYTYHLNKRCHYLGIIEEKTQDKTCPLTILFFVAQNDIIGISARVTDNCRCECT